MKKRRKWKSAEEKRKHEELAASWESIKAKYKPATQIRGHNRTTLNLNYRVPAGRTSHHDIPSITDSVGIGAKKESKQYSGNKIVGIGMLHKSNLVPVFSEEEAKDQASMRR